MCKTACYSGSMDSSNPCHWHWRGKRLHHHCGDVCCVFVLCIAVSFVVCRKVPEHNLKVHILPYYKVNRHYFLTHIGMRHTKWGTRTQNQRFVSVGKSEMTICTYVGNG
jgi:hypothetical protein